MKQTLTSGVAIAAVFAGAASAEDLTVFGPWLGPDQELVEAVLSDFADKSGHAVSYVGSDSFEQQIVVDAEAGSAPNIAVFPQPGLAADLASRGFLTPLKDGTGDWIKENYAAGQSWVDLGTYAGPDGQADLYGFFYKVDVKSLVWYSPENFEDAGYDVPETMEDLKALTDQMVADGETPWCIGLGSGGATGWPATDWVEDMMLRTQSPSVYDQWVSNEIPFDSEPVVNAIEEFGYFARNDDYVAGGADAVASTDFRDSPKGLFDAPPQCYMHRQASFIPAFFPEGTEVGLDADFFRTLAGEASRATGREMSIQSLRRNATVDNGTGVVSLSFTWSNFVTVTEDGFVVEDAVLMPGDRSWLASIEPSQRLVVETPTGYRVTDTRFGLDNGSVVIDGPHTFRDPLSISYQQTTVEPDPEPNAGPPWSLIGGALIVGLVLVVIFLVWGWRNRPDALVGIIQLFGRDVAFLVLLKQVSVGGVSDRFTEGTLPVSLRYGE